MKRSLLLITGMLVASGAGVTTLQAGHDHPRHEQHHAWMFQGVYFEGNVQYMMPFEDEIDESVYYGGKFGVQLNEWISLEVEGGFTEPDVEPLGADLEIIPILFNVRLDILPLHHAMIRPYIFGGVGVALNDIDVPGLPGVEIDDSFAAQGGAGVELVINEMISVYGDVRVMYNEPDINVPFLGEDSVELNAFLAGGGVILRF